MGRRRKGRGVTGVLLLDKPPGISSNHALQRVRRIYEAARAGHTGSLDVPATGLLPICLGEATKLSGYLLDAPKAYRAGIRFGVTTTTGDAAGEILERAPVSDIDAAALQERLQDFTGPLQQVPPMYSAIKVNGERLYKLAYRGEEVARAPRAVTVYEFKLLDWASPDAVVDVRCSKGTYIRQLAVDVGDALGCGAHLVSLRRTGVGSFDLDDACTAESLTTLKEQHGLAGIDACLLPADAVVQDLPAVRLADEAGCAFRHGQSVQVPGAPDEGVVRVYQEAVFLGMAEISADGRVAPRRLFAEPADTHK